MSDRSVAEAEAALEAARNALAVARRAHDAAMLEVGKAALAAREARQAALQRSRLH